MGRASGTSVTCYVHGDKSPYSGAHHAPNIYLKFTATVTRDGMDIKVTLSNMTFKALGGYGYPMTVYAAVTRSNQALGPSSSGWVKLDKSTATTAVKWTRHPANRSFTVTNDANTEVYIQIAAYSNDAKQCYDGSKRHIATYTYNAPAANYTLTYNANGGSNAPASVTVSPGSSVVVTSEKPYANLTVNYYSSEHPTEIIYPDIVSAEFNGWNTSADGTGDPYSEGASIILDRNKTLYAQWKPIAYTVLPYQDPIGITLQFNAMGGRVSPETHLVSFEQLGYGTSSPDIPNAYQPGQTYQISGSSLTPMMTLNLHPRYANITTAVVNDTDLPPVLANSILNNPGHAFEGWYFEPEYEQQIQPPYSTSTNPLTLYAKWKPQPVYKKTETGWVPEADSFVWQCVEVTEEGVTKKVWKKIAHVLKCVEDSSGNKSWKDISR